MLFTFKPEINFENSKHVNTIYAVTCIYEIRENSFVMFGLLFKNNVPSKMSFSQVFILFLFLFFFIFLQKECNSNFYK